MWKNTILAWRFKWKKTWKCWYFLWKNKFARSRRHCFWWKTAKNSIKCFCFLSNDWPPPQIFLILIIFTKLLQNKKKWKVHHFYLLRKISKLGGSVLIDETLFFCICFRTKCTSCYCEFVLLFFFWKNTFFNDFYLLQIIKIINFLSFFHKKFCLLVLESIDKTSNFFFFCVFCAKIVLFLHTPM